MKKLRAFLHHYKAIIIVSFVSLIIVCCHTVSLLPTQADVPIAQKHWQSATMEELTKGYQIYADKCTQCHEMKKPQDFSEDDWTNNYMPSMGRKAKLNDPEYQLVLHYILAKRDELTGPKK